MFCCWCLSSYYHHEQLLSFRVPLRALSATGPNMLKYYCTIVSLHCLFIICIFISVVSWYLCARNLILGTCIIILFIWVACTFSSFNNVLVLLCVIFLTYMCCPWLCSHGGWFLLKCSAIGIGFNGVETNCGIARILGILLMNSWDM